MWIVNMIIIPNSIQSPLRRMIDELGVYSELEILKEESIEDHTLKYVFKGQYRNELAKVIVGAIHRRNCRCGGSYAYIFQVSLREWYNGFVYYSYLKYWQAEEMMLDVHDAQMLLNMHR